MNPEPDQPGGLTNQDEPKYRTSLSEIPLETIILWQHKTSEGLDSFVRALHQPLRIRPLIFVA